MQLREREVVELHAECINVGSPLCTPRSCVVTCTVDCKLWVSTIDRVCGTRENTLEHCDLTSGLRERIETRVGMNKTGETWWEWWRCLFKNILCQPGHLSLCTDTHFHSPLLVYRGKNVQRVKRKQTETSLIIKLCVFHKHPQTKTRLKDEKLASVKGKCET